MNDHDVNEIRDVLLRDVRDHFAEGFADRAASRWRASRTGEPPLGAIMARQFRRVAPFAAAASVLFAANNLRNRERSTNQSVVEAVLGIGAPAVRADSTRQIESLDELYGLTVLGDTE